MSRKSRKERREAAKLRDRMLDESLVQGLLPARFTLKGMNKGMRKNNFGELHPGKRKQRSIERRANGRAMREAREN